MTQNILVTTSNQLDLSVFNELKTMFGDASELEHVVHSLKGASAQIGTMIGTMGLNAVSMTME